MIFLVQDVKVAFFAEGADAEDAKAAGADVVGGLELIEEILKSGKIDFDRCLATPKMMPRVYKISRILNNHGLMPNPKVSLILSLSILL
jgi:ribosomal protein L1